MEFYQLSQTKKKVDRLTLKAQKKELLTVDLENQKIVHENGEYDKFEVDSFRKKCLLEGLDDIGLTLKKSRKIDDYESKTREKTPWINE